MPTPYSKIRPSAKLYLQHNRSVPQVGTYHDANVTTYATTPTLEPEQTESKLKNDGEKCSANVRAS
jgi:hypothetical protein